MAVVTLPQNFLEQVKKASVHDSTACFVAGSDIRRSDSYAGVVPVALTNAAASASEAVEGAPISGPGSPDGPLVQGGGETLRTGPSSAEQVQVLV